MFGCRLHECYLYVELVDRIGVKPMTLGLRVFTRRHYEGDKLITNRSQTKISIKLNEDSCS